MEFTCPAALPIAGAVPQDEGCLCRIETSDAGMRGARAEASILTPASDPRTIAGRCTAAYDRCPTWRAGQANRRALALAEQE